MVNKMRIAMTKLLKTKMTAPLTYVYFNAYLIKSVYFGYSIIKLDRE